MRRQAETGPEPEFVVKSDAKQGSSVWKMMWPLAWRYLLWLPVGTVMLVLVLAYPLLPPACAIGMIIGGYWPWGLGILLVWGVGMYFYKRAFYKMFEGYGGL